MDHPVISSLAKKYDKSAANILLRFQTQRGVNVIPKRCAWKKSSQIISDKS